jgi:hypothetical protein
MKTREQIRDDMPTPPCSSCGTGRCIACPDMDKTIDYVQQVEREAVIEALEEIKKKTCVCKIEFSTSTDCDTCAEEHKEMYEICEKLAELKGAK